MNEIWIRYPLSVVSLVFPVALKDEINKQFPVVDYTVESTLHPIEGVCIYFRYIFDKIYEEEDVMAFVTLLTLKYTDLKICS